MGMDMEFTIKKSSTSYCFLWASLTPLILLTTMQHCGWAHSIGINYGQIANNLPDPSDVVPLVKSLGVTHLKLYDSNPKLLSAFANSNISFTLGLGNEFLSQIQDPNHALSWLHNNLLPHLPRTNISSIAVGNEVLTLTLNDTASATSFSRNLLPAMQSLRTALVSLNLSAAVSVTTPHSLSVLQSSYPPSTASFRRDLLPSLSPILSFLDRTGAPFLINAYPFFAYKASPARIPLDFALADPGATAVVDPASGLKYGSMLSAQVDAVYSALSAAGFKRIPVVVSETGWPSKGDADEVGASAENARRYNGNLFRMVSKGTPMRPGVDMRIYVFALFNENMKPGPTSERNYGLFRPDGSPAYELGLGGNLSLTTASSPPSSGNGTQTTTSPPRAPESSSTGYLSVSSSAPPKRRRSPKSCVANGLMVSGFWAIFGLMRQVSAF